MLIHHLDLDFTLVVTGFFVLLNETILVNSLYAPGTPSGSSLKKESPV